MERQNINSLPSQSCYRYGQCVKTMRLTTTLVIFIVLVSCRQTESKGADTKTLDFETFSISVPSKWQKIEVKGIDSHVGKIALDDVDTITFDLGPYSNNLWDPGPTVYDRSFLQHLPKSVDTSQ